MAIKRLTAVMSFHTTSDAIALSNAAHEQGLCGRLAPIPRQISAGCGMAWREPVDTTNDTNGNRTRGALEKLACENKIAFEQLVLLML